MFFLFRLLSVVLLAALLAVIVLLGASLFVGVGYVLSALFPLSLFQATLLGLCTLGVLVVFVFGFHIQESLGNLDEAIRDYLAEREDDEDADEEDWDEEEPQDFKYLFEKIESHKKTEKDR